MTVPTRVEFLIDVGELVEVRAGGGSTGPNDSIAAAHTCALTEAGQVYCWGANCTGQLGLGGSPEACDAKIAPQCPPGGVSEPVPVALGFRAVSLAVGSAHSCALSEGGRVYCWGFNYFQQAGVADPVENRCVFEYRRVEGVEHVVQLVAGSLHTCALIDDGTVTCWGRTDKGVLGEPVQNLFRGPKQVPGLDEVIEIAAGHGTHNCARRKNGELVCWGGNDDGDVGIIETVEPETFKVEPVSVPPTVVPGLPPIATMGLGGNHTCAIDQEDGLWCWGSTWYGAAGTVGGAPISPTMVPIQ